MYYQERTKCQLNDAIDVAMHPNFRAVNVETCVLESMDIVIINTIIINGSHHLRSIYNMLSST